MVHFHIFMIMSSHLVIIMKKRTKFICEMVTKYNLPFTADEINFIIDCIDPPSVLREILNIKL